jgi:PhzF family phenazine biosynthesis protein
MPIELFQVDAFTDIPFKGNPAAVCILPGAKDPVWMQDVAREMNLSETAFLSKETDGFNLRWFTPTVEEELCGHATLASAHILWDRGYLKRNEQARFFTRSGLLTAELTGNWIELDFPAEPSLPASMPEHLEQALGVVPKYVGKNRLDYLVEVGSEQDVRDLKPDFNRLCQISSRGFIVTSQATMGEYDFVSRFFAPQEGIPEDPVTGSAHCCLGPFWASRLGKEEMIAYQASSRGGVIRVSVCGKRVRLSGQAVTVFHGKLII